MNDQRTPVLHIGWWRNGYHEYEPRAAQPSERHIRILAALLAVVVALPGTPLTLLALVVHDLGYRAFFLGFLTVLPVAAVLGWLLGPRAVRSTSAEDAGLPPIAVLAVLVNAAVAGGVLFFIDSLRPDAPPGNLFIAPLFGAFLGVTFGVITLGLPALALAVPAGLVWARLLGRLVHDDGSRRRPRRTSDPHL